MSLQVWLPLVRDLNNQGLSDITVTNSGATFTTNGKLGGCYSFNNNSALSAQIDIGVFDNNFSFCGWVYYTSTTSAQYIFHLGGGASWRSKYAMSEDYSGTVVYYLNGGEYRTSLSTTSSLNTWVHYAYTYDGVNVRIYVNGELKLTEVRSPASFTPTNNLTFGARADNTAGTAFKYGMQNGMLNDVRIYNHCLSAKEIKEISKGLVCHYKLSDLHGEGLPNLLKYTKVTPVNQSLLGGTWSSKLTIAYIDGCSCYYYPKEQGPTWFASGAWLTSMSANTTYTYSAYIYFTADINFTFTSLGHFQVYNSSSTASDKSHEDIVSARVYEPSTIKANTWTKVRITFTTNNLSGSYFQVYPRYAVAANVGDLYFRDCKLELGDTPTAWTPNTLDPEYSQLGYNESVTYDSSGHNYHSTPVGGLTLSTNTARNTLSTQFVNGSYIQWANITPTGYANTYTFAWWGKFTIANSTMQWGFANGNRLNLYMYSTNCYWNTGNGTANPFNVALSDYGDNNWHHFAITGDGTTSKLYLDGEYKGSAKTYVGITGTTLIFNGWDTSNNYNFNGSLSDFRLYSTPLSAEDIKALYQIGASIDKSGNMYAYEFNEV